jgi:DNA-binding MarR family transcriptional regulator
MATERVVRDLMDSFRRLVQALRTSHRAAGHLHITGAQLFVINVLGESERPLSVGEVAERTLTDQSTVSAVTNRLVEHGLVERTRSEADSRRVLLDLTKKGRALFQKAPATVAQRKLAEALARLRPSEAAALRTTLARIVEEMDLGGAPAQMMFEDEERKR